jgi:MtaA/CmuA family methyltransferase
VWRVPLNDIGTPVRHDITRFDDERLQSLDILRPHITETLRRIPTAVVARHNISVGLTGPFSQVAFLMGVERVMTAMIEQPDKLKAAIEYRVPFATTWAERIAELGAPSVWIGEGLASGSLISAAQYVNFVLPYEQQVTRKLQELGVPVALHICGRSDNLLDEMARSGADCLEIDWQVNLGAAKARLGSRVSLKGNLHTTRLAQSSPAEVYEDARCAIKAAGPGGAFILSSGCALGRDTPPENVDAMARAARDFGGY